MIDILRTVHSCSELVDYWDVGMRADTVVLRVRSRTVYSTDQVSSDLERTVSERLGSRCCEVRDVTSVVRLDNGPDRTWRVLVELVIA
jgi:CRISPR/Cas system-associated protein Csm6